MATWFYRIGTNCALDIVSRRKTGTAEPDSARRTIRQQGEVQLADSESRTRSPAAQPRDRGQHSKQR